MRRRVWAGGTRIGAALLGVLLAAGGLSKGTVWADVSPYVMIVPGQSIGPVRLGMSMKDVTSVLGNPVPAEGGQVKFPRVAVTVMLEDSVVVRVSTTNPQFRTSRGAGVGSGLDDSARLIGDPNQTVAVDGSDTTIGYPFQGIGFVFRDGRAVEVFVVQAVGHNPSLPPPLPEAVPALPPAEDLTQPTLPSETAPSAGPQPAAQAAPAAPSSGPALEARSLAETVDPGRGILRITGTLVQTGAQAGRAKVFARVFRAGGSADGEIGAQSPEMSLPPGGTAPFALDVSVAQSVVLRYAVEAVESDTGNTSRLILAQRAVPREAYVDLARALVQVSVQLGPPSNIGARFQVLVSIAGTGPIPPDWVRQVEVEIPFTGGSTTVTLVPGQTQTIFVPSTAQVGAPQVQRVDLNAS
jgi:hypothetical protein